MRDNVTPIYLGGKTPRLGIVNSGDECGELCVHNGADWETIVDLKKYAHLISTPIIETETPAKPETKRRGRPAKKENEK